MSDYLSILKSLSKAINFVCSKCLSEYTYFSDLWCRFVCSEVSLMISNVSLGHYVDAVRGLKVVIEGSIQSLYYLSRYGLDDGAILAEVRRRQKSATSFNIKMLGKIRGLHSRVRKDLLKLYLKVAEFSHPTSKVIKLGSRGREAMAEELFNEVLRDVCDYVAYSAIRLCGKGSVPQELIDELMAMGFKRVIKYLRS